MMPQLPFGMDTTKWYIHKPPQHGIWIVHPPVQSFWGRKTEHKSGEAALADFRRQTINPRRKAA
jgi:hypothetical protein